MIGKTNAGAGGGHLNDTDALLRVSAPAGSIVTITKGSATKSDHGHENASDPDLYDYYFIIHQSQFDSANPWTVTATLGKDSASKTIKIYLPDEYDVELIYALVLFDNGTKSPILGGLTALGGLTINNTINFIEDSSNGAGFTSNNSVDLSDYSKLTFIHTISSKPYSTDSVVLGVYPSKMSNAQSQNRQNFTISADPNIGDTQSTVDISGISQGWIAGVGYGKATVSKIYLSN